jgi:ergothioneine biosynthesis protein EgtB
MPLRPERSNQPRPVGNPAPLQWINFEGGIFEIGYAGSGFSFDNESPRHEVLLRPFQLASRLVTNAEYLEFMNDGGYRRPELWLSDGWDTVCAQAWNSPLYWEAQDEKWFEFTYDGMRELDPAAPVCHVSYYEADAFAHWSKARLAREEEWEVAAPAMVKGNLQESHKLHPERGSGAGLQQMFGDVWEWTSSPYVAYPGFAPAAGAIGEYNGKFMCNQFVLRGGSCATPASHIRASYRNFFPPHARWQFMGIRLAK